MGTEPELSESVYTLPGAESETAAFAERFTWSRDSSQERGRKRPKHPRLRIFACNYFSQDSILVLFDRPKVKDSRICASEK